MIQKTLPQNLKKLYGMRVVRIFANFGKSQLKITKGYFNKNLLYLPFVILIFLSGSGCKVRGCDSMSICCPNSHTFQRVTRSEGDKVQGLAVPDPTRQGAKVERNYIFIAFAPICNGTLTAISTKCYYLH